MCCDSISPLRPPRGRSSAYVAGHDRLGTNPIRVRNIFICSGCVSAPRPGSERLVSECGRDVGERRDLDRLRSSKAAFDRSPADRTAGRKGPQVRVDFAPVAGRKPSRRVPPPARQHDPLHRERSAQIDRQARPGTSCRFRRPMPKLMSCEMIACRYRASWRRPCRSAGACATPPIGASPGRLRRDARSGCSTSRIALPVVRLFHAPAAVQHLHRRWAGLGAPDAT